MVILKSKHMRRGLTLDIKEEHVTISNQSHLFFYIRLKEQLIKYLLIQSHG